MNVVLDFHPPAERPPIKITFKKPAWVQDCVVLSGVEC